MNSLTELHRSILKKNFLEAKRWFITESLVSPSVQIPFCQRFKSQSKNGITTPVEAIF